LPLIVGLLFPAAAVAGAASAAEPIELHAEAVPLDARDPARTHVGGLMFRGGLHLTSPAPIFGGLSALHIDEDGASFLAVTDQGHWLRANLAYDASGRLAGAERAEMGALGNPLGQPLIGKINQDAESLAQLADGSWVVGYERRHRLWRYSPDTGLSGPASALQAPKDVLDAPSNGGLEALTTLRDGRLVALCEELLVGRGVRGFVRAGRRWQRFVYPVEGLARPSAATGLPSGDLLVLDRGYSPDAGVMLRLRRVAARDLRKNAVVASQLLAEIQPPLTVDNFEGLAARRTPSGETLIYLLSDDNFSAEQRTLLMMFVLVVEPGGAASRPPDPPAPRGSESRVGARPWLSAAAWRSPGSLTP
jgi:hypothetical protein